MRGQQSTGESYIYSKLRMLKQVALLEFSSCARASVSSIYIKLVYILQTVKFSSHAFMLSDASEAC